MKQISVSLRLGYPHQMGPDGPRENFARLEIRDEVSGTYFLELELDATQLMNLMRGSTAYTTAEMRGLDRIGKRMEVDIKHLGKGIDEATAHTRASAWVADTGPWDTLDVRRVRDGWQATARRWLDVEPAEKE